MTPKIINAKRNLLQKYSCILELQDGYTSCIIFSEFVLDENVKTCHIFAIRTNLLLSSFFQFEVYIWICHIGTSNFQNTGNFEKFFQDIFVTHKP